MKQRKEENGDCLKLNNILYLLFLFICFEFRIKFALILPCTTYRGYFYDQKWRKEPSEVELA